jgi:hypothetical protein
LIIKTFDRKTIASQKIEQDLQYTLKYPCKVKTLLNQGKQSKRNWTPFITSFVCFFLGTTWICISEGVQHMPALQLAGIRQFIEEFSMLAFSISKEAWPKQ